MTLNLICVECASGTPELYKKFPGSGGMRISYCNNCGNAVDRYIEHDHVLVFLDIVLHKSAAYRHLLFNTEIKNHWKVAILFLFCDAYAKWVNLSDFPSRNGSEVIFYAALEFTFYQMFVVSVFEFFTFLEVLNIVLHLVYRYAKKDPKRIRNDIKGVVISSFGKIFVLPALIWGTTNTSVYLNLIKIFIFTSNVQALKILCSSSISLAIAVAGVTHLASYAAGSIAKILIDDIFLYIS